MNRDEYYSALLTNQNALTHHGVKGQKHGKRQYQNQDGSLTPLGRIHYGIGKKRSAKEKAPTKEQAPQIPKSKEELKKEAMQKGDAKYAVENSNDFTTQELRDLKSRYDALTSIKELSDKQIAAGKKFTKAKNILNSVMDAANYLGKVADAYKNVNKFLTTFGLVEEQKNKNKDKNKDEDKD